MLVEEEKIKIEELLLYCLVNKDGDLFSLGGFDHSEQ